MCNTKGFELLKKREIIDILIGDVNVLGNYHMPRLSGPQLCSLSTSFGLVVSYEWGGTNLSRWMYMENLLKFLNKHKRVPELLSYLFKQGRFEDLNSIGDIVKIQAIHKEIVRAVIENINTHLLLSNCEIRIHNNCFFITSIGNDPVIDSPKVKVVSYEYIRELPQRIKDDFANKDYDSVITKSRTLLEEVFIYIIEKLTHERYKSKGDLVKIYSEVTELLNMRQRKDWDNRINELLGGIHKIINAISSMRNINSDAHGVGVGRIAIKKREATIVANGSMMIAEFFLSVYNKDE